jgi:PLP dependent protein
MNIKENLLRIKQTIADTAKRAGRAPEEIRLMAVSKTRTADEVRKAYEAGQRLFGENRVKEGADKFRDLPEDIELHLIGHLQRNKVKHSIPVYSWVESIDKFETAEELNKRCEKEHLGKKILLEINTSGEDTKNGFILEDKARACLDSILASCPALEMRGLMTIAPFTDNENRVRSSFSSLRELFEKLKGEYKELNLDTVSMGMSSDYQLAIEEGSTLVRVGTAIFGKREQ